MVPLAPFAFRGPMSTPVTINGIPYPRPDARETNWVGKINTIIDALAARLEESVVALYATNAAQSINHASFTIINFEDVQKDTHTAVTVGAAWKFTAPVAGKYLVTANVNFTAFTSVASMDMILHVFKNGADHQRMARLAVLNGPGPACGIGGSAVVELTAGQYIDIRIYQGNGVARTLENNGTIANRVAVVKLPGAA